MRLAFLCPRRARPTGSVSWSASRFVSWPAREAIIGGRRTSRLGGTRLRQNPHRRSRRRARAPAPGPPACRCRCPARRALTCTAIRSPCHSTRSCSSRSMVSSGLAREAGKAAQEAGAIGVEADVAQAAAVDGASPRRDRRAARESARARNRARGRAASSTTLTMFGVVEVGVVVESACAAVLITQSGRVREQGGAGVDQRRLDQRLVALHVDDDVVAVEAEPRRTPRPVGRCRWRDRSAVEHDGDAVRSAGGDDAGVVGGHHDALARPTARRVARRARSSAGRRCRPAACRAGGSRRAAPG